MQIEWTGLQLPACCLGHEDYSTSRIPFSFALVYSTKVQLCFAQIHVDGLKLGSDKIHRLVRF